MKFFVQELNSRRPIPDEYPSAVLTRDAWDDYGYKTTFSVTLYVSENEKIDLGSVRILRDDQQSGFTRMPQQPFETLSDSYCSLGGDLDFYDDLMRLGRSIYRPFLRGLRDAAFDPTIKAVFEDQEGFRVSLLRSSRAERTLADATRLFARTAPPSPPRKQTPNFRFKTRFGPESNSFLINFKFRRRKDIPGRFNVVIGYNGAGKTRLLANLAIVASGFGYEDIDEKKRESAGKFIGEPPPFQTVVVISYSAFDRFFIPGANIAERERITRTGQLFGYVYCGLREREGPSERLKTPDEVQAEFTTALGRIRDADRMSSFVEVLRPLIEEPSFQHLGLTPLYGSRHSVEDIAELFAAMSSGQKIVIKILADLVAQIPEKSPTLVLIDEPETHLHPPLLAAFLHSIRRCLDEFDGYAIISTHSPVVLQEIPAQFVHVLRRTVDHARASRLSIETFGENIGVLTQEVFNLNDGSTDWHETLRRMARRHTLSSIEDILGYPLGFTARSYVQSVRNEAEG